MRPVTCVALACCLFACKPSPPAPKPAKLVFLTNLSGVTEPCGCTSVPRGGLDRVAGRLDTFTHQGPTGFVTLGNTFFTYDPPAASLAGQEKRKAQSIARILARLRPLASIPGPMDTQAQRPILAGFLEQAPMPVLWQQLSQSKTNLGGTSVGIVGVPEPAEAAAINQAAAALRQSGAALVLVAMAQDTAASQQALLQLKGVDAVVQAGGETPNAPRRVGNTVVLTGGSKGEYLGVLSLRPSGQGPWTFFEGIEPERTALQARLDRLQAEASHLPEGEAKGVRLQRVEALQQEIAALQETPPTQPSFTWQLTSLDRTVPPSSWATAELAEYNRALCAPARAASAERSCPPAAQPRDRYAGNSTCQGCHAGAWNVYAPTAHAHAWKTLTDAGKDCDLTCVGCHTIGFEKPGGFCHLADAQTFANVGCESCHGPAQGHVEQPQNRALWSKAFVRSPAEAVCRSCHTPEHSDTFDYPTYLPRVLGPGHGKPQAAQR